MINSIQSNIPKLRLWLATDSFSPLNGQFGVPLISGRNFLEHFRVPRLSSQLCPLSQTPSSLCTKDSPYFLAPLSRTILEAHLDNDLGLKPGYYLVPLSASGMLQAFGRDTFFPKEWWERDDEMADWNYQREAYLAQAI